jgi:hypothetical protein
MRPDVREMPDLDEWPNEGLGPNIRGESRETGVRSLRMKDCAGHTGAVISEGRGERVVTRRQQRWRSRHRSNTLGPASKDREAGWIEKD